VTKAALLGRPRSCMSVRRYTHPAAARGPGCFRRRRTMAATTSALLTSKTASKTARAGHGLASASMTGKLQAAARSPGCFRRRMTISSALLTAKTASKTAWPGLGSASTTGMLNGCVQPSRRKVRSGAACCDSCWLPRKRTHSMHTCTFDAPRPVPPCTSSCASYGPANHTLRVCTCALPSARGVGRLREGACAEGGGARFR